MFETDPAVASAEVKLIVIDEANGYELCVPEDGQRPRDSFWRKKAQPSGVAALVAAIKVTPPASPAKPLVEIAAEEPATPLIPIRIDVARLESELLRVGEAEEKEEPAPKKVCIDCEDPFPLAGFYPNALAKDGCQSRCKSCDKKRRAEYNQGLHPRASEKQDRDRDAARKRAMKAQSKQADPPVGEDGERAAPPHSMVVPIISRGAYIYEGVRGGPLISGYVK